MNDKEKKVQNQGEEHNKASPSWEPARWAECRPDIGNTGSGRCSGARMSQAVARCSRGCRYFLPLVVMLGIVFLILGHYLVPQVIGTCWMIPLAMMAVMALSGILAMRIMAMSHGLSGCCGA